MASNATNRFPGNGATTSYEINFVGKYLSREHVFAYIENDTTKDRTPVTISAANWLNDTTLQRLPVTPVGSTMVIYRKTPAAPLVNFEDGAWLTPKALDTATRQGLFKAVEHSDGDTGTGGGGTGGPVGWDDVQGKPYASATVPGIVKVGAGLAVSGDGVLSSTGSGGGGGGVTDHGQLSGLGDDDHPQYLDAARGNSRYAALGHTHALSTITVPGGGPVGYVATFNGTNLELAAPPTGGGGGGGSALPVVVYIGDSLGSDHPNLAASPAVHLERTLNAGGYACRVVNLSINGHSFFRANTTAVFGTQTMVQRAIALNPAAIIVALGFNDTVAAVDGRTLAQVQSDATTFFSTLRTALPSIPIVAATELAYDKVNFTPATLKNRGVLPILMTLRTTGILAGCFSSEILEDSLDSAIRTRFTNFNSLDTTIRGLTTVSAVITLDLWKIARLGLCSHDGLHLTAMGSALVATTWRKAFTSVVQLRALSPNLRVLNYGPYDGFMNTDGTIETGGLWDLLMQANGADWSLRPFSVNGQHTNRQGGPWLHCNPVAWFLPSKGAYRANSLAYTIGSVFTWELRGVAPSAPVESSIDGGAFTIIDTVTTSHRGDYLGSAVLAVTTPGTYAVRYKVANEVHGPISLVVTAGGAAPSGSWQPKVISGSNIRTGGQNIPTPGARDYIDFEGAAANVVSSHPDLTFSKIGASSRIRVNVPAGKSVWVRLAITQLVTHSTGNNNLWILGAEVLNDASAFQYNLQLDAKHSPINNYAIILTGSFVGKLTETAIFVPWVLVGAGTGGRIGSSAANGNSSFWSLEVINEI